MSVVPVRHPGCPLVLCLLLLAALTVVGPAPSAVAQPGPGEVVIAWHVTIAPSWFDPSTAPAQITPFGLLYALHDALVRPLPGGQRMGRSLAESWTESRDGLTYEFKLRQGVKFHNGDPVRSWRSIRSPSASSSRSRGRTS